MDSGILDIIEPIVIANGGQIIVESTPKQDGISGMTFVKLRKAAEKDPKQYSSQVFATEYMDEEQLDRARQACITRWGNDFKYRQEYLLDEGQALETSYYGNIINSKEQAGLIGEHPWDPKYPVYSTWDLGGGGDSTAGVFWQYYDMHLHIIDAHQTHIVDDAILVKYCNSLEYAGHYGWHFFPHDGSTRDSDGIQRISKLMQLGLPNASLLRRRRKEAGLVDAIQLMNQPTTTFHAPTTAVENGLIDTIRLYRRKWNANTGNYEGPEHNTASHYADAIRYVSDSIKQFFDEKTGRFLIVLQTKNTIPAYVSEDEVNWDF
jgi:hypothetical protein